jgi:hypothetical protein
MLQIGFQGWFQCRLATDPDPYDERRGVSGYVHAYVGEPDLDRRLWFQNPPFSRRFAPEVSVRVSRVVIDGRERTDSPLAGAAVDLLGHPVFEGRNGVVAEDGLEPVYPFDLAIQGTGVRLRRAVLPADPEFPFEGLSAGGVELRRRQEIQDATGIADLGAVWAERLAALEAALAGAGEPERTGMEERIAFLRTNLESEPAGAQRFFGAMMNYSYELGSADPEVTGLHEHLGFEPELRDPWQASFWLGGWDADVLCGFCRGELLIPEWARRLPLRARLAPRRTGVRRADVR